jgi:hypothetical protein
VTTLTRPKEAAKVTVVTVDTVVDVTVEIIRPAPYSL